MSGMQVVEIGRGDTAGLAAYVAVSGAAERQEIGDNAVLWTYDELVPLVGATGGVREHHLFNGLVDGEVVATGRLVLVDGDPPEAASTWVGVLPDARRRGLGSQMLEVLEAGAAAAGRKLLDAQPSWPYDGSTDGRGSSGVEFALARGYAFGLVDVQRVLDLPVDDALLAALAEETAPHHSDHEIRSWTGPVPDDLVVGWLEVNALMATDAPAGEMERAAESVDVAAFRASEVISAGQGRTNWHTIALDPAGRVVAFSLIVETLPDNPYLMQSGTLVHRDHRGHRLGTAVKVANHRALQAGVDVAGRRMVTWNAEVNEHMIGINERLGYVCAARSGEFQKKLT